MMRATVLTALLALVSAAPASGQDDFVNVAVAAIRGLESGTDQVEWLVSSVAMPDDDPDAHARRMAEVARRAELPLVDKPELRDPQIALRFWALHVRGDTATIRIYQRRPLRADGVSAPNSGCTALMVRVDGTWVFEGCSGGWIG